LILSMKAEAKRVFLNKLMAMEDAFNEDKL
jgi:hypothetical protein